MAIGIKRSGGGARNGSDAARKRRHLRVRKHCVGTQQRPRLVVSRSLRHMVAQLVDDATGRTLASASTHEAALRTAKDDKTAKAKQVGKLLAERAKKAGVEGAIFDRGGNAYHGRVAAVADGAREGGLNL